MDKAFIREELIRRRTKGKYGPKLFELIEKLNLEMPYFEKYNNMDDDGNEVEETQRYVAVLGSRAITGKSNDAIVSAPSLETLIDLFLNEYRTQDGYPLCNLEMIYDLENDERLLVKIEISCKNNETDEYKKIHEIFIKEC